MSNSCPSVPRRLHAESSQSTRWATNCDGSSSASPSCSSQSRESAAWCSCRSRSALRACCVNSWGNENEKKSHQARACRWSIKKQLIRIATFSFSSFRLLADTEINHRRVRRGKKMLILGPPQSGGCESCTSDANCGDFSRFDSPRTRKTFPSLSDYSCFSRRSN